MSLFGIASFSPSSSKSGSSGGSTHPCCARELAAAAVAAAELGSRALAALCAGAGDHRHRLAVRLSFEAGPIRLFYLSMPLPTLAFRKKCGRDDRCRWLASAVRWALLVLGSASIKMRRRRKYIFSATASCSGCCRMNLPSRFVTAGFSQQAWHHDIAGNAPRRQSLHPGMPVAGHGHHDQVQPRETS